MYPRDLFEDKSSQRRSERLKENSLLAPLAERLVSTLRNGDVIGPLDPYRHYNADQCLLLMELLVEIAGGPKAIETLGSTINRRPGLIIVETHNGNKWRIDRNSMRQIGWTH